MSLRYDDFMNPLKGNAAFNLKTKIDEYKEKYFASISQDMLVSCVYNKSRETYSFFFKIPSEGNDKYPTAVMYDVLLEFHPNTLSKKEAEAEPNLKEYGINIFSNSPSFVFTFTYIVKNKYKALPKTLPSNYLSKIAASKPPETRNTFQIMTIEKTTWWAFFHLQHNGYLNKNVLPQILSKQNESYFIRKMLTQPQKLKEINDLKQVMREDKLREKANKNRMNNTSYQKITHKGKDPLAYSFQVAHTNPLKATKLKSGINKYNALAAKNMFKTDLKVKKRKR